MRISRVLLTSSLAVASLAFASLAVGDGSPAGAEGPLRLEPRGQFLADAGDVGETGTEISAFDPVTARLFSTNGALNRIDVVDISDVHEPALIESIDLAPYGAGVQSVATSDGLVAAAVAGPSKVDDGVVVLFDTTMLEVVAVVEVGALPDMVTFTPDGKTVLIANEAEPLCTGVDPETGEATFIDPEGSVSLIDLSKGVDRARVRTAHFRRFNERKLTDAGVRLNFGDHTVAQQLEPEYIAVSDDGMTAYVSLQEANAIAVVDVARAKITAVQPLGLKDYSEAGGYRLDASNDDDVDGNFQHWPVYGMYMPDAVAAFSDAGNDYLITANEGDGREWFVDDDDDLEECFVDEDRIDDFDLDTSMVEFSDPDLQADERLGRLKATVTALSEQDDDGRFTKLAVYGGRSITIRAAATGEVVWDSADDMATDVEHITLNAGTFDDGRSDDKGSEPEAVTVGAVAGRRIAVAGLERTSGVVLYDISDPTSPAYLDYSAPDGDISVEGLVFVDAADSPSGVPLVIASHEVSNTIRVFEITGS